jgi:hypothetical protein
MTHGTVTAGSKKGSQEAEEQEEVTPRREPDVGNFRTACRERPESGRVMMDRLYTTNGRQDVFPAGFVLPMPGQRII